MRLRLALPLLAVSFLIAAASLAGAETGSNWATVSIVVGKGATPPEILVAEELADYLSKIYTKENFSVVERGKNKTASRVVRIGTPKSAADLLGVLGEKAPKLPESYVVTSAVIDGKPSGLIVGADPAGVMYGVHGLLERLGCGFYLSFETLPEPRASFDFDDWQLTDRPLSKRRFVLNWHNFLSGCSTWNLEDWNGWATQLQKMGYNGIMVHAYGNNPMAGFPFQGKDKPVGYLSSTRLGRDWSTNHVVDVRNLFGGEVFDSPVFGAEAAVDGSDRRRTEAAQSMMAKAFEYAERRGVDVYFAVDVDTASANPQELISLLPESARFRIQPRSFGRELPQGEGFWLANPDTPEGYAFYKAQVAHLLEVYPGIDVIALWVRMQATPWMGLKLSELPPKWREEYNQAVKRSPEVADMWRGVGLFGVAKIASATQRALRDLRREDVKVGLGSWCFNFFPAADRFMPKDVELFPLDYEILVGRSQLGTPQRRADIAQVCGNRPVWPIVWAHHDDGQYIGPPYEPLPTFQDKLNDARAEGYGVIHWLNRPLDIYFKSLSRQVWQSSTNEPLEATCRRMAGKVFGAGEADRLGKYLHAWIREAPKVARETRDYFIDHKLPSPGEIAPATRRRLALLESVNADAVSPAVNARLGYFKGLERYLLDVHRCEASYHRAQDELKVGKFEDARRTIAQARPEEVIENFARMNLLIGATRGDRGLVVSMNTRWLTHYVHLRQELGLEPIRYNFAPTSHDPLAQVAGRFTFYFGPKRDVWQCYGRRETGNRCWTLAEETKLTGASDLPPGHEAIYRGGIETDEPFTISLKPIMRDVVDGRWPDGMLSAGEYHLQLLLLEPAATAAGRRSFDLTVSLSNGRIEGAGEDQRRITRRVDPFKLAGGRNRPFTIEYSLKLDAPGEVIVKLTPHRGSALICGAVLEPLPLRDNM